MCFAAQRRLDPIRGGATPAEQQRNSTIIDDNRYPDHLNFAP
jgi:hypothetical protein